CAYIELSGDSTKKSGGAPNWGDAGEGSLRGASWACRGARAGTPRTHSERMPRGQAGRCQTPLRTVVLEETVWTGCLTPIWATWGFAAKTCLVGRSLTPTWPPRDTSSMGFRTSASGASIADIASPRVPAGPGRPV